ncbi:TPA: hypothetical protein ACF7HH_003332 [Salmonella enterica]|nr:hypothetical protein [Salmonella enterica subsp. enterica serovar Louisiana]HBM0095496.1 hypothetical protein [Salmonella enterica subsp. enterica serovar Blitta]
MATLLTTGLTVPEYYKHGGVLDFELDALEVGGNSTDFENYPSLVNILSKGFELPATSMVSDPKFLAPILVYGDFWTKLHAYTYAMGGSVVYKRLPSGRYHARCEWH